MSSYTPEKTMDVITMPFPGLNYVSKMGQWYSREGTLSIYYNRHYNEAGNIVEVGVRRKLF